MKHLLWLGLLLAPTAAQAQVWFTADCYVQNGERISVAVTQGQARVSYGLDPPQIASPEYKNGMMTIIHVGSKANMVMSINVETGRAYVIVQPDRERRFEYNATCKINVGER